MDTPPPDPATPLPPPPPFRPPVRPPALPGLGTRSRRFVLELAGNTAKIIGAAALFGGAGVTADAVTGQRVSDFVAGLGKDHEKPEGPPDPRKLRSVQFPDTGPIAIKATVARLADKEPGIVALPSERLKPPYVAYVVGLAGTKDVPPTLADVRRPNDGRKFESGDHANAWGLPYRGTPASHGDVQRFGVVIAKTDDPTQWMKPGMAQLAPGYLEAANAPKSTDATLLAGAGYTDTICLRAIDGDGPESVDTWHADNLNTANFEAQTALDGSSGREHN